jgi:hypothetical protein
MKVWLLGRTYVLAVVFAGAAGCGGGPPYHVAGKVTFDGKPLPLGRIYFDPDPGQQNTGPSGYTDIVDGEYDTSRAGKGVSGGATVVRIQGFKKEGADASGFGAPLFQEYTVRVELPRDHSTKDFDIPAKAAGALPPIVPLDQGPVKSKGRT